MGNIVIDTDEEIIGDMKERSEENAQNEAQRNKPTKINGEKSTRIVQKGMSLLRASRSAVSSSLQPHGLYRPVEFSRPEYMSEQLCPSPGDQDLEQTGKDNIKGPIRRGTLDLAHEGHHDYMEGGNSKGQYN